MSLVTEYPAPPFTGPFSATSQRVAPVMLEKGVCLLSGLSGLKCLSAMLIDLVQLRTFVAVAEEQHLTRAADRLNVSQSAASAHVRAIEERLGTQLFVRTNRSLELTRAGQMLAIKARTLLNEEALFISAARELKGKIEGNLIIATSSEPGTRIGDIVAAVRAVHPLVSVDLLARPSSAARQGLISGEFDVGVLLGPPLNSGFSNYKLTDVKYRIVGPIAWKDRIETADWSGIAELPWLTPSASSAYTGMLNQMFSSKGVTLNSVVRFDNSAVGRAALYAGAGMMLLREEHAAQGEADGRLSIWPVAHAEMPMSAAHQSGRRNDPLIKAFLEAARISWPDMVQVTP